VYDGPTVSSTSSTLDGATLGVQGLNITPTALGTQSFTVGASNTNATAALNDFVTKFNAVESFISTNTKVTVSGTNVTTGLLYGNSTVTELGRSLRSMIFQSSSNATGPITRLADLGLDFAGTTNTLSIKDPTALSNALKNPQVQDLFASDPGSAASQFSGLLNRTIGPQGSLISEENSLSQTSASYTTQIANMQRQLDAQKAALTAEFVAMENAESTAKSQQTSLAQQFGTSSS
jgi:flagellar hook-associated protein 2